MPDTYKVTLILEKIMSPGGGLEPVSVLATTTKHLNPQDTQIVLSQTFNQVVTDDHERGNTLAKFVAVDLAAPPPGPALKQVYLQWIPDEAILNTIKAVRAYMGLVLKEAKDAVDARPGFVSHTLQENQVAQLVAEFQDLGCDAYLKLYGPGLTQQT